MRLDYERPRTREQERRDVATQARRDLAHFWGVDTPERRREPLRHAAVILFTAALGALAYAVTFHVL